MILSLEDIRHLARIHGYQEIDMNEHSRVISFKGGPHKATRINVYYTTGTVATCLNHPKKGKTQLFRRNVDLEALGYIFENPRRHTGVGYYERQNIRQKWKDPQSNKLLPDSARRWIYVGNATGLVETKREMTTIVDICTRWDELVWKPGSPPALAKANYECGSHGGLLPMLFDVVQESFGDFEIHLAGKVNDYNNSGGSRPDPEHPGCGKNCPFMKEFLEKHSSEVWGLRPLFLSLRKEIQLELAHWFLGRFLKDGYFTNLDVLPLQTKFHDDLHGAHKDYGAMMYPKKAKLCNHCGVMTSGK